MAVTSRSMLRIMFAGDASKRSTNLPGRVGVGFAGIVVEIAVRRLQSVNWLIHSNVKVGITSSWKLRPEI
jgi:hypothetical protein